MKKLIFILMAGSLFIGCYVMKPLLVDTKVKEKFTTMQNLSQSSKVTAGMTTDEVRDKMGDEPIMTELDRNVEEWHYCRSDDYPPKDRFLAIYFVDNKVIAKKFYTREKGIKVDVYGSCEHFVKTGDYKVPPEVQEIYDELQSAGEMVGSFSKIERMESQSRANKTKPDLKGKPEIYKSTAYFKIGMTKKEFNIKNPDITENNNDDEFTIYIENCKDKYTYIDGEAFPLPRCEEYTFSFKNDTLVAVYRGRNNFNREIDYSKYPNSNPK